MFMAESDKTNIELGLTSAEANLRLEKYGSNEIPISEKHNLWWVILEVMREPMFILLAAAAFIYVSMGEKAESLLVAAFALMTIMLVIIQQNRSEKAIQALQALSAPNARIIRDGQEQKIAARGLVIGDILLVAEGERIGADAIIRRTQSLQVDESILTGESIPVHKLANETATDFSLAIPGGDDQPFIYSGTLVVAGHAIAEVLATGAATRTGNIGQSLDTIKGEDTHLQKTVTKLVRIFGILAIIVSSALVLFYGLSTGNWFKGALSGIALAMAMMPEEFPVVLVIFLSLGALRLSYANVLVRRSSAIEALGAATILCVDKTGTLTRNEMRLHYVSAGTEYANLSSQTSLSDPLKQTLIIAQLASRAQSIDPMDRAVHIAVKDLDIPDVQNRNLIHEFGLTPELLAVTTIWQLADSTHIIAAKGAPEAILGLCHTPPNERIVIEKEVQDLAQRGWRVLAVAKTHEHTLPLPSTPHGFGLSYLGLIAFEDPLRDSVPAAVRQAHDAGITVAMVTGDYPATARAIAQGAGIDTDLDILTGSQIANIACLT
jgi:P-type Ca2+ transporter type 2C